ncbi:MAG: hypothetical protein WCH83_10275 [Alphaproteobacteria bacterium]
MVWTNGKGAGLVAIMIGRVHKGLVGIVLAAALLGGCQTTAQTELDLRETSGGTVQMVRGEFTGTERLSTGSINRQASQQRPQAGTRIYLIRGLADVFSRGIDDLADKLTRLGYVATTHTHGEWETIARDIIARQQASRGREVAVIVGHSLGADAVASIANTVGAARAQVGLAVAFDPVSRMTVMGGAKRFVNYFQSNNGWAVALNPGPQFRGRFENVDLRTVQHLNHFNIEKDNGLHARVIAMVAEASRGGGRRVAAQ